MITSKIAIFALGFLFAVSTIGLSSRSSGELETLQETSKATAQSTRESSVTKQDQETREPMDENKMQFGNFSVSLAVKDIKLSKEFYEKLDFNQVGGNLEHNYVIMQNGTTTIGLFQGMFEENILTFNPGWNHKAETLEKFQDVRELQAKVEERGITPVTKAEPGNAPASFVIVDPDGNSILIDQHVPKSE